MTSQTQTIESQTDDDKELLLQRLLHAAEAALEAHGVSPYIDFKFLNVGRLCISEDGCFSVPMPPSLRFVSVQLDRQYALRTRYSGLIVTEMTMDDVAEAIELLEQEFLLEIIAKDQEGIQGRRSE